MFGSARRSCLREHSGQQDSRADAGICHCASRPPELKPRTAGGNPPSRAQRPSWLMFDVTKTMKPGILLFLAAGFACASCTRHSSTDEAYARKADAIFAKHGESVPGG